MINGTKIYKDNGAKGFRNLYLTINKGEFVFIVGPSGSGKSTLIKTFLKEENLTSGELIINNQNITKLPSKKIPYMRRKMGVVFQDFRLLPNKTVFENVAFAMQIVETSRRKIRKSVPRVLAMVGLQEKSRSYPNQLSGGEQQRTALARAIVNNPPLLICDEPTGNLDPHTSWEIMYLLEDINKMGTTVVVATHAWDIVNAMKKRVVILKDGSLIKDIEKGGYNNEVKNHEVFF